MTSFNEALAHLMIAKGSVALPKESPHGKGDWRYNRFGDYYGSCIEASKPSTEALLARLDAGATVLYGKCGPSDFGQENRFNNTFTSTQLQVQYALFPIVLSDDPDTPVEMVAGISELSDSFVKTLELLFTGLTLPEAIQEMRVRVNTKVPFGHSSVEYPALW